MKFIGIDVSKAKLDCCWLRDAETQKFKTKVFKNIPSEYSLLARWLTENTESDPSHIHVVLEATSIYHEGIAIALYDHGFKVSVINPLRSKEFAKSLGNTHKTDAKDSKVLALFGQKMAPDTWHPEPLDIREIRALSVRLQAVEKDLQRERNRLEKAEFSNPSSLVVGSLQTMIDHLETEKKRLEDEIDDRIDRNPELKTDRSLLESIPAVGPVLSRIMLIVMHQHRFKTAGQLAAFLGLIPRIQQSGVWRGHSRMTKTGDPAIRSKLYMAAVVARKWNPDINLQFERLTSVGKTKMQAIGAAMRKLVQICFGVLKHQSEYRPQLSN